MNVCVDACRKQLGDADHVAGYPINMHWEEKAQTGCQPDNMDEQKLKSEMTPRKQHEQQIPKQQKICLIL